MAIKALDCPARRERRQRRTGRRSRCGASGHRYFRSGCRCSAQSSGSEAIDGTGPIVLSSPYLRAQSTAKAIGKAEGFSNSFSNLIIDERLREKEFGILDRLTRLGIEQRHPELAASRQLVGKFYYRPPAGESWCDVILRLRSVIDTISLHHGGKHVLIVAHQVVVLCMRYLLENMDEKTILAIDAEGDVANCAVTEYVFDEKKEGGSLVLTKYNFVAPLEREGAPVTSSPDAKVAAR